MTYSLEYMKRLSKFYISPVPWKVGSMPRSLSITPKYSGTCIIRLKTHKFHHLPDTVFTKSCLFSLSWKTTFLERPQNLVVALYRFTVPIGFRSRFSQCVDYMRFNEKSFCFRWQETTNLMLFFNTKTSSLVVLCDLRYLTGNISSVMTKHMGVQRRLHRFAYLIVQIILWFYS